MRPTRSFGTYDPAEWLTEGRGLYISARTLRAQWAQLRRNFRKQCRLRPEIEPDRLLLTKLTGIPRSSMLLLAYSAEMYLKSGLVKNLTKCRPGLIDREIRFFGHQLDKISFEINLSMNAQELDYIHVLANMLVDGRYPLDRPQKMDGRAITNTSIKLIFELVELGVKINSLNYAEWFKKYVITWKKLIATVQTPHQFDMFL